jgi:hypothetical protein
MWLGPYAAQAIEGEKLDGVAVLVTRHYGGIKLGTGEPLAGASSRTASRAVKAPMKHVAGCQCAMLFLNVVKPQEWRPLSPLPPTRLHGPAPRWPGQGVWRRSQGLFEGCTPGDSAATC